MLCSVSALTKLDSTYPIWVETPRAAKHCQ